MKTKMKIFWLDGDSPVEVQEIRSSMDAEARNDFNGTVLVDSFLGKVGLFYYSQEDGLPCDTYYKGRISSDGLDFEEVTLSASFPSIQFAGVTGLGHYVEGARFTEPGVLFPSWSQPIATSSPCQECFGNDYSLAVLGSRVIP